jgi:predicted enzyme related to lactoylglutathione lyase
VEKVLFLIETEVKLVPRVVHFEIPAELPERAVKFYKKVFDWKIEKWEGPFNYWLVTTGEDKEPGINGAIMEKGNFKTTINTVGVSSVDEFLEKIKEAGGKVIIPKGAVSGQGYIAYVTDTEGNIFGLFQSDSSAK